MRYPVLDLRHLQMISVLAETPRVTDAAERLGITPSALSHRIREAERRLDVSLFDRIHKRLRITPAGEYLATVGERLLADLARAESDVHRMNRGARHVVRLAVEAYSAYHWLPHFIKYLAEHEEGVDLHVVSSAGRNPVQSLTDMSVDMIIVSGENASAGTNRVHLFDDELLFIMSPHHRLAGREHIIGEDIVGEDFITYTRIPEPDREYAKLFWPNQTFPNWTETVELPEAIIELVAADLGTSILAGWAVKRAMESDRIVSARVGSDGIIVPWYAATRRSRKDEETYNHRVAEHLAVWSQKTQGFQGYEEDK
jgi:LysR family transcriptional regulator, regulator for metE and metH